jgi:hypothetical protein
MQLAYGRACEARATLQRATMEGVLIAAMTPVIGWMIDWRGNVDDVLIMVSSVFFLCLSCALGGYALFEPALRPSRGRDGLVIHGIRAGGNVLPHRQTTYTLKKGT